ncbi:hypothetical protein [Achromobacter sp. DMS1]|uniref:hypothetical protein n=1 Tax=Achromobacter sp. DMS1 TaxID=1688405 RepID=UPI000B320589
MVFHGVKRDADHYYEEAARLLAANPAYASNTLIVAPRYVGSIDSGFPGVAAWRKSSWEEGGESVQAPGRPAPVSSFQVSTTCCACWPTASACRCWKASCWPAIRAAHSWCSATRC